MEDGPFNILFKKNLPNILEDIFFYLEYDSFKNCMEVCNIWRELLQSPRFMKKAKSVFSWRIQHDGMDLCFASRAGNIEKVKRIVLCKMVSVDFKYVIYSGTALFEAASNGRTDIVQLLLPYWDLHHYSDDETGWAPLHEATALNHKNVVELLLERGSDPNRSTIKGWTPLHLASRRGEEEMVKLLLRKGANPTKHNSIGENPFHLAKKRGHKKVAKMLQRVGGKNKYFE